MATLSRIVRRFFVPPATLLLLAAAGNANGAQGCACSKQKVCDPSKESCVVTVTHVLSVTGAGQALSRITKEPVDEGAPAISPDGKTLLFTVKIGPNNALKEETINGVDPDTGARRTLYTASSTMAGDPTWMPDGSVFVYPSNAPGQWSVVRALSNSPNAAISVITSGDGISRPTVAPDGTHVAFSTTIRGVWNVAVSGVDGSQLTLLGEGNNPAWSPDGSRIAFTRNVNGHDHIFLADAKTGTNLVQITSGDVDDDFAAWSPDGKVIVFASNRGWNTRKGGGEGTTANLFVLSPDGTGLTQVTAGDGLSLEPAWGFDGWIYFSSNQAGNFDLWRLKPAGELAH
jgi:TolB protein